MLKLSLFSAVIIGSLCAALCQDFVTTTIGTVKPHFEPTEHESFSFIYEGSTHQMLMLTQGKCYIWALTAAERTHIHTDAGLRQVELRLLKQVNHSYFTTIPQAVVHTNIVNQCLHHSGLHHHVDFYLVH